MGGTGGGARARQTTRARSDRRIRPRETGRVAARGEGVGVRRTAMLVLHCAMSIRGSMSWASMGVPTPSLGGAEATMATAARRARNGRDQ